jgi:hypothetical protein
VGEVRSEKTPSSTKEAPWNKRKAEAGEGTKLYPFGINRVRLEQAAKELQLPINIVANPAEADLFITAKKYYRQKPQKVRDAEAAGVPIYVLRSNTIPQMKQFLDTIYPHGRAF